MVFSAVVVAIAMGAMLVFRLNFLRSFGYVGVSVVLLAAASALTVVPAALVLLGNRLDALDVHGLVRRRRRGVRAGMGWHRLAMVAMRFAPLVAVATVAVLVALALPFGAVRFGEVDDRQLPGSSPARLVAEDIRTQFPGSGGRCGGVRAGVDRRDHHAPAGRVFVTGPDVVRSVTGEEIDQDGLGGLDAHARRSGVVHVAADSESDAYGRARQVTSLLAQQRSFDLTTIGPGRDLSTLLPTRSRRAYAVHPIVHGIVDEKTPESVAWVELQAKWAPNVVVGFGRLAGRTIGVIANNPMRKGGCLDSLSAEKAARFVRLCDCFGVPLVVLVNLPGYLPGVGQEWGGVVRRGAKLLHAFGEATVPRVMLITRKSYGGAYIAMNSRSLGATAVYAWPHAEIGVMSAEAAVNVLYRKKLAAIPEDQRSALHAELVVEHHRISGGVTRALDLGVVDEVIDPAETRIKLACALASAPANRGRHNNIPL